VILTILVPGLAVRSEPYLDLPLLPWGNRALSVDQGRGKQEGGMGSGQAGRTGLEGTAYMQQEGVAYTDSGGMRAVGIAHTDLQAACMD
jgi:hypothetical protein